MFQKLKKLLNKYFKKPFTIGFEISEINDKKIFQDRECFDEFLKMFKNMYISKLTIKKYADAEIVKEIIEELIGMYSDFYEEENKENNKVVADVVTQLQDKMKDVGKNIGQ